jgi:hypothetical protein
VQLVSLGPFAPNLSHSNYNRYTHLLQASFSVLGVQFLTWFKVEWKPTEILTIESAHDKMNYKKNLGHPATPPKKRE